MGYLRKSKLSDLNHVAKNMRVMDKIEAYYQTGKKPEDALRLSYLYGQTNMTIAALLIMGTLNVPVSKLI